MHHDRTQDIVTANTVRQPCCHSHTRFLTHTQPTTRTEGQTGTHTAVSHNHHTAQHSTASTLTTSVSSLAPLSPDSHVTISTDPLQQARSKPHASCHSYTHPANINTCSKLIYSALITDRFWRGGDVVTVEVIFRNIPVTAETSMCHRVLTSC